MDFRNQTRIDDLTRVILDEDSDEYDRQRAMEERDQLRIAQAQPHRRKVEHVPDENERMRDWITERNRKRDSPDYDEDDEEWQREVREQEEKDRLEAEKAEAEERRLQAEEEFNEKYEKECEQDPNFAKRDLLMRQADLERAIHDKLEDEDPEGPESNLEIENRLLRRWGEEYVYNPAFTAERDRRVLEAVTVQKKPWSYKTFSDVIEQMEHEVALEEHRRDRAINQR